MLVNALGGLGRKLSLGLVRNAGWLARGSFIAWGVRLRLTGRTAIRLGRRSRLHGPGLLAMGHGARLRVGDNTRFEGFFDVVIDPGADLKIGEGVYLGCFTNIRCNSKVSIGARSQLGQFVSLVGGNYRVGPMGEEITHSDFRPAPVVIGENAWLGANVVVLPGRTVGDGAVVGAGSVVTRDVEPGEIVGGSPLKTLGRR